MAEVVCVTCGHPESHHDAGECWTDADGNETHGETSCPCSWWEPAAGSETPGGDDPEGIRCPTCDGFVARKMRQPLFEGSLGELEQRLRHIYHVERADWEARQQVVVYPTAVTPTFCEPDEDMRRVMQAMRDEPGSAVPTDEQLADGYPLAVAGSATPTTELRAAAEALQRLETPFGAYERWRRDGNTADADKLQAWDDARVALSRALAAGSATPTRSPYGHVHTDACASTECPCYVAGSATPTPHPGHRR